MSAARAFVLSLIACLTYVSGAMAQPVLLRGYVVHDADGQIVRDVLVVATRVDGPTAGLHWSAPTGDFGYFQFGVVPGRYRITVVLSTQAQHVFEPQEQLVDVAATHITTVTLRLRLRLQTPETVTVNQPRTTASLLLPDGSLGARFDRQDIANAPTTHGPTVQSMLATIPGVVFTESVGTLAQFTAGGQRRFANRLTIDGVAADLALNPLDSTGPATSGGLPALATSGGTQTLISQEAISEITVRTSVASSDTARAPGAQTTIVTRSGGDRLSATGLLNVRPDAWSANNWFSNAGRAPRQDRKLLGSAASVGGPLAPRRMFYFVTFEHQQIARPVTTSIDVPSEAVRAAASPDIRPLLDAFPRSGEPDRGDGFATLTRRFPASSSLHSSSLRLDANLPAAQRVFVRLNYGSSSGDAMSSGQAGMPVPFFAYRRREVARIATATTGWTATLSPTLVNDLRGNISAHRGDSRDFPADYGDAAALPLGMFGLAPPTRGWVGVSIAEGNGTFLGNGAVGTNSTHLQLQVTDTLTIVKGRHQVRAGFDYARVRTTTKPAGFHLTYTFDTLSDALDGNPLFNELYTELPACVERTAWSMHVQDSIRVTNRLTVDIGLRYDVRPATTNRSSASPQLMRAEDLPTLTLLPAGTPLWRTAWLNLAPRLSSSYQLRQSSGTETTVAAAWGVVFDDPLPPGAGPFGSGFPFRSRWNVPSTFPADVMVSGEPFSAQDSSTYYAMSKGLKSPKTYQWHAGINQILPWHQRFALTYAGAAGRDLIYSSMYVVRPGGPFVDAFSNDARSSYHAALLEYTFRPSSGLQARLTHAWSHSMDHQSGEQSRAANVPNTIVSPDVNYGPADFDRRHLLQLTLSYEIPHVARSGLLERLTSNWRVELIGHVRSGSPFDVGTTRSIVPTNVNSGIGGYFLRPDLIPNVPVWLDDSSSPGGRRLNPAAFFSPRERRQGNLGRNALHAAPLRQVDVALSRSVRIGRLTGQARLESYNLLNTPQFGRPYTDLASSRFGRPLTSYADSMGTGTLVSGGLPAFQQLGSARSIQLTLRLGL